MVDLNISTFLTAKAITLGPLVMNTLLFYILMGVVLGSTLLFVSTRKDKPSRKFSSDIITNFFLIVILTWKLLPILLAPGDIISNPISILYASGGSVGIGIGAVLGIIYLVIKLFLFWKHPVGAKDFLPLRNVLRPLILFFASAIIVSSSLFLISFLVNNVNSEIDKGATNKSLAQAIPTVGDMAPDFELRDINGEIVSLADYKGKWVILNFWATWCPPCKAELPTLNRFYKDMNKDKVVLLGINASGTERISGECKDAACVVSTFVRNKGINFPILLDFCKGIDPCVSKVYGAGNLPTTVVVSPEGIITKIKTGVVDSFWLRSVVNQ